MNTISAPSFVDLSGVDVFDVSEMFPEEISSEVDYSDEVEEIWPKEGQWVLETKCFWVEERIGESIGKYVSLKGDVMETEFTEIDLGDPLLGTDDFETVSLDIPGSELPSVSRLSGKLLRFGVLMSVAVLGLVGYWFAM